MLQSGRLLALFTNIRKGLPGTKLYLVNYSRQSFYNIGTPVKYLLARPRACPKRKRLKGAPPVQAVALIANIRSV
jgi:hypothetical protein